MAAIVVVLVKVRVTRVSGASFINVECYDGGGCGFGHHGDAGACGDMAMC